MNASAALVRRAMLAVVYCIAVPVAAEEQPLHVLIDQRLVPPAGLAPERCSDAEFLRRVSLDLIGMTPTAEEARAFLADTAEDKRQTLIDRLFASPHYSRHLAAVLDVMLMERRAYTHVSADEWQAWLVRSVRENKPWNVLAREILRADGDDPAQRAPARFALDRASDTHVLTRDIGRVFFGRDLQCAQCHDHPLVPDYLQSDYHGLMAFVAPSYPVVRTEGEKQTTLRAEKAGGDLAFESVFVGIPRRTGARMPEGVTLDEPFFLPGDEYQVAPADNVKAVPKFSRRAKLAEAATNGSNAAFNENIANRLWAHMFGRGLVHPPDMHHPENPALDPELLRLLSERFAAMNFDIRAFLRELALTEAYQRSIDLPAELFAAAEQAASAVTELERQRAELEQAAEASSQAYEIATDAWQDAEAALLPVAAELDSARNQYAEAKKQVEEAVKAMGDAKSQLQAKSSVAKPVEQAAAAVVQAVAAVPEDAALAEAAQALTARSQELNAEVEALTSAFDEKTTAISPPTEALGAAAPALGAALAKLTPLHTTMHQAEDAMLAARGRAATDAETLAALQRRLDTTRHLGQVAQLNRAVAAASDAMHAREAERAVAQKELDDFLVSVAQSDLAKKSAGGALAAASSMDVALVLSLDAAVAERDRRIATLEAAKASVVAAQAEVAARQSELDTSVTTLADHWADDFTVARLKPLSPEQLCWTVLRATGVYDRQWQAEAAELDQSSPLTDEQKQDPAQVAAREAEIEQRTFDKLKGHVGTFVSLYGAAAGQPQGDFFATAEQALFAANAEAINGWTAPAEGSVTDRLVKHEDPHAAAEELYLALLSRLPSDEEAAAVASHLATRPDKSAAAQELVWALLNSVEFRFNH